VGVQPLLVGIPGSNAAWGMDICLLWLCLRLADRSSGGVILYAVCLCDVETLTRRSQRPTRSV
jgi:hypothetical protein